MYITLRICMYEFFRLILSCAYMLTQAGQHNVFHDWSCPPHEIFTHPNSQQPFKKTVPWLTLYMPMVTHWQMSDWTISWPKDIRAVIHSYGFLFHPQLIVWQSKSQCCHENGVWLTCTWTYNIEPNPPWSTWARMHRLRMLLGLCCRACSLSEVVVLML